MLLEQAEVTLHGNMEATVPCQMAGSTKTEAMLLLLEQAALA